MKVIAGYWNCKTGAFHKEIADFQEKLIADGILKPLYTEPQGKDNCPSCEYHKQSERVWRDFAYKNKPLRELTDEEIKIIAYPFESVYTTYDKQTDTDTVHTRFDQLDFARAILRKAQEK